MGWIHKLLETLALSLWNPQRKDCQVCPAFNRFTRDSFTQTYTLTTFDIHSFLHNSNFPKSYTHASQMHVEGVIVIVTEPQLFQHSPEIVSSSPLLPILVSSRVPHCLSIIRCYYPHGNSNNTYYSLFSYLLQSHSRLYIHPGMNIRIL